jgi:hypothetical protein
MTFAARLLPPALVLLLVGGCGGSPSGSSRSSSPASPHVTVEVPIAPDDVPQTGQVRSGHQLFRPLAGHCGIVGVTGSHAEFVPKRPLCHLRLRISSDDATAHAVVLADQKLVLTDGTRVDLSPDAMHVKRQPTEVLLGARNAAEVDLWWEPPVGAHVRGVLLVGDRDIDQQGTAVAPATNRAGVELPLRGF